MSVHTARREPDKGTAPETKLSGQPPELNGGSSELKLLSANNGTSGDLIQALPAAIYTTDADGRITSYNEAAAALWGCRPEIGKSEFCGSWKLYWPDGRPLPHDECPMALALKYKQPIRGMEAIAERPDGSRVAFVPYPTPLFDASGALTGAINMLVDISDRKITEQSVARSRDEQRALYEFTDRLFRAVEPAEIYAAALEAIGAALGCERASILLFDDAGGMKFVAWRGLSDGYRAAVEGHSPWTAEAKDPEPICVPDVATADLPSDLRSVVKSEGIAALAFVPLVARGRLIGKFMIYYSTTHRFADAEVELALTIARQLGLGIEHTRAEDVRRRAHRESALLASIIETSEDAIVSKDLQGTITSWNRSAQRVFGYMTEEMIGKSIMLLIPPDRHNEEHEIIDRVRRGERVEPFDTVRRRKDGSEVHVSITVSPVKDASGRIAGASKIARDISERKRFEAQKDILLNEIKHRVKNTLATVQAMARQTLRTVSKDELQAFMSRLHAFGNAYDLLTSDNWDRATVRDVVSRAIEPFQAARFAVHGPAMLLDASQALKVTMVLHELATNAVKYGALSSSAGYVSIAWQQTADDDLHLIWKEIGGPPVSPPKRKGFGSLLIEQSGENVSFSYAPTGLICTLRFAL